MAKENVDRTDVGTARRIAVGVDGSANATAALEWAATQAQLTGAVLAIVTAFGPGHVFVSVKEVNRVMREHVDEATAQAKRIAPELAIASRTHAGLPESVLIEESAVADLLVVGSRGRGGFTGLLLGSVSRRCVQLARCPVIVVGQHRQAPATDGTDRNRSGIPPGTGTINFPKEGALMTTSAETDRRIVVGVDGSKSSIAALEWAATEAELTGAGLKVLMTWEWPISYGWALSVPSDYDPTHESEKLLGDLLQPIREAHPGVSIASTVVEGHPSPVLVEASQGADLLVVGSRGHGEFAGMLLGSVSEHCVSNAHCPVLVMRDGK
ncbi:MAG: universal stress protein [Acidimicrobiales bacterium]|nr:universal stress protein [Acidimicrobiales bacterium]